MNDRLVVMGIRTRLLVRETVNTSPTLADMLLADVLIPVLKVLFN